MNNVNNKWLSTNQCTWLQVSTATLAASRMSSEANRELSFEALILLTNFQLPLALGEACTCKQTCHIPYVGQCKQTLEGCNLIGLQNSCSGTNPGIVMSPNLPFFAEVGPRPTRPQLSHPILKLVIFKLSLLSCTSC